MINEGVINGDGINEPGGNFSISGVVTEQASPVARTVRLYLRSSGELLDTTTSNAGTGEYSFENLTEGEVYNLVFEDDAGGNDYSDKILSKITPSQI